MHTHSHTHRARCNSLLMCLFEIYSLSLPLVFLSVLCWLIAMANCNIPKYFDYPSPSSHRLLHTCRFSLQLAIMCRIFITEVDTKYLIHSWNMYLLCTGVAGVVEGATRATRAVSTIELSVSGHSAS